MSLLLLSCSLFIAWTAKTASSLGYSDWIAYSSPDFESRVKRGVTLPVFGDNLDSVKIFYVNTAQRSPSWLTLSPLKHIDEPIINDWRSSQPLLDTDQRDHSYASVGRSLYWADQTKIYHVGFTHSDQFTLRRRIGYPHYHYVNETYFQAPRWTAKQSHSKHSCLASDGKRLFVMDEQGGDVLDPTTGFWQRIANRKQARRFMGCAVDVHGGYLYVVGGMEPTSNSSSLQSFERIKLDDLATGQWTQHQLQYAVSSPSVISYHNGVLVLGGANYDLIENTTHALDHVQVINPETGNLSHTGSLRYPVASAGVLEVSGAIFLVAGFDGNGKQIPEIQYLPLEGLPLHTRTREPTMSPLPSPPTSPTPSPHNLFVIIRHYNASHASSPSAPNTSHTSHPQRSLSVWSLIAGAIGGFLVLLMIALAVKYRNSRLQASVQQEGVLSETVLKD